MLINIQLDRSKVYAMEYTYKEMIRRYIYPSGYEIISEINEKTADPYN